MRSILDTLLLATVLKDCDDKEVKTTSLYVRRLKFCSPFNTFKYSGGVLKWLQINTPHRFSKFV